MLDKGKQAAVTSVVYTKEKASGKPIFENQSTVVLRGSGGFNGKKQGSGRTLFIGTTCDLMAPQTEVPQARAIPHQSGRQTQL